jgi:hypothetical protein
MFRRGCDKHEIPAGDPVHVLGLSVGSSPENVEVAGEAVLLSHRFDHAGNTYISFLLAMSMTGLANGDQGSHPGLVDAPAAHGAAAKANAHALFRRMVLNVLISTSTTTCAIRFCCNS